MYSHFQSDKKNTGYWETPMGASSALDLGLANLMEPRSGSIGQGLPDLFKLEEPGALHNAPGHAMATGGAQKGNSLTSGYPRTGLPQAAASHYGTDNMGPVTEAGTGFQGSGSEATGRGQSPFQAFPSAYGTDKRVLGIQAHMPSGLSIGLGCGRSIQETGFRFRGVGLGTETQMSEARTPLSTPLSGAGWSNSEEEGLPMADGSPRHLTSEPVALESLSDFGFGFWKKEPLCPLFPFQRNSFNKQTFPQDLFKKTVLKPKALSKPAIMEVALKPNSTRKVPPYGIPHPPRQQVQKVPLRRQNVTRSLPLPLSANSANALLFPSPPPQDTFCTEGSACREAGAGAWSQRFLSFGVSERPTWSQRFLSFGVSERPTWSQKSLGFAFSEQPTWSQKGESFVILKRTAGSKKCFGFSFWRGITGQKRCQRQVTGTLKSCFRSKCWRTRQERKHRTGKSLALSTRGNLTRTPSRRQQAPAPSARLQLENLFQVQSGTTHSHRECSGPQFQAPPSLCETRPAQSQAASHAAALTQPAAQDMSFFHKKTPKNILKKPCFWYTKFEEGSDFEFSPNSYVQVDQGAPQSPTDSENKFSGVFQAKKHIYSGKGPEMCQECKWRNQDSPMYPIFCEKCIQGPKIFREVSHIYENGQENTKFGGGSKSEIFSPFERQVGANVGPKKARINMIGSSGSGQPPQGPPPQPVSASNEVPVEQQHWVCDQCRGNWYETNLEGADWMTKKLQILIRRTGSLSHECDACTGVTWDGGHERRGTETGLFWAGNTPWIFKGFATEWVTAEKVRSRHIDRPLWTPPALPDYDPKKGVRVIIMAMESPSASAETSPATSPRPFTISRATSPSDSTFDESEATFYSQNNSKILPFSFPFSQPSLLIGSQHATDEEVGEDDLKLQLNLKNDLIVEAAVNRDGERASRGPGQRDGGTQSRGPGQREGGSPARGPGQRTGGLQPRPHPSFPASPAPPFLVQCEQE